MSLWHYILKLGCVAITATVLAALVGSSAVAQTAGYDDVPDNAYYSTPIAKLAEADIFDGTDCSDGFCPDEPIDRKTMAVWIVRALDGEDPASVSTSRFADVDVDSFHGPFVDRMAQLGVTKGCGDGSNYCPDGRVTRGQMAAFLVRAFDLPAAAPAGFTDTSSSIFSDSIDALAASRITAGCGDGTRYCPNRAVSRGQMATFLARALKLVELPPPRIQPRIAFTSNRDGDHEIFVMNDDGSSQVQLTHNENGDFSPEWSPERSQLVYTGVPESNSSNTEIFVVDADGTTASRRLTYSGGEYSTSPEWSPDGTRIAFSRATSLYRGEIYTITPQGTNVAQVTTRAHPTCGDVTIEAGSSHPVWISSGTILYTQNGFDTDNDGTYSRPYGFNSSCRFNEDRADIQSGIRRVSASSLTSILNASVIVEYHSGYHGTSLSPASWTDVRHMVAYDRVVKSDPDGGIWTTTLSGQHRQLTEFGRGPRFSPDGSRIVFKHETNLFVVTVDGSSLEQLTFLGATYPAWSPDGHRIAFASDRDGDWEIYVINADGTNLRKLTDNSYDDLSPDW